MSKNIKSNLDLIGSTPLIEVNLGYRINKLKKTEKTPKTKVDLIEAIKEADYPNIKFYKARPSDNRFELNFNEIQI